MATYDDIARRHLQVELGVRNKLAATITGLWALTAGFDDASADEWTAAAVPAVIGAQVAVAGLTSARFDATSRAATGQPAPNLRIRTADVTGAAVRGGTDPSDVYLRAIVAARVAVSEGIDPVDALRRGRDRAVKTALTDLQLTRTHMSRRLVAGDPRIVGYRRQLNGESCALCEVASTQRYHRGDLMPIHPGCDCSVAEIYGQSDPGHVIDPDRLDQIQRAVADELGVDHAPTDAESLRRLIVVREHGELGPVLAVRKHQFTGPDDLA